MSNSPRLRKLLAKAAELKGAMDHLELVALSAPTDAWAKVFRKARDVLDELDRLRSDQSVPEGWRAVPEDPTGAMLIAARDWSLKKNGLGVGNDQATGCYRAMLAASPPPPIQGAWRPIPETVDTSVAPWDGKMVDLFIRRQLGLSAGPNRLPDCWYAYGEFRVHDDLAPDGWSAVSHATHWMERPPPPSTTGGVR